MTLRVVGQAWTLLLIREAMNGVRRFDDFHRRLRISRPLLSQRLSMLVDEGLLYTAPYGTPGQRKRFEYRLTRKGWDLYPVLVALHDWGMIYVVNPDSGARLEHCECGAAVHARLICEDGHELALAAEAMELRPGLQRRAGSEISTATTDGAVWPPQASGMAGC